VHNTIIKYVTMYQRLLKLATYTATITSSLLIHLFKTTLESLATGASDLQCLERSHQLTHCCGSVHRLVIRLHHKISDVIIARNILSPDIMPLLNHMPHPSQEGLHLFGSGMGGQGLNSMAGRADLQPHIIAGRADLQPHMSAWPSGPAQYNE
jgi:hypothetical protein